MIKFDLLVENQNLRKILEIMREDISKNCVDCENRLPFIAKYKLDCDRCVLGKYREVKI